MKNVKKILTLLLALAMLLALAVPSLASEYTVKKGDTLSKIAKNELGSTAKWKDIYEANKGTIKDPGKIYVGQKIVIPDGQTPAVTPGTPATPSAPQVKDTRLPATKNYIPAVYVTDETHLTDEILTPVFHQNVDGPTIGTTLLGVVVIDGQYFRDINNNGKLDVFEDWRETPEVRAEAMAKAMSDYQLTHNVANAASYTPNSTSKAAVVDENGKPVWDKIFSKGGGWGAPAYADSLENLRATGFRTFVMRTTNLYQGGKPIDVETYVWFNNGLEQYSEYEAIKNGEAAVPFTMYANPVSHGMPSNAGVTAAALGDGSAANVLKDTELDRQLMWAMGVDGIYGPQIDLVTDPRWSRNSTTYGEREDMAAEIAAALVEGYQNGTAGIVPGSVLVTVKHFPGDGASYNGFESHGQTGRYRVYSTENSLADYQLVPFIAAFEAGAAGIMPGYSQPIIDARIAEQTIIGVDGEEYDIKYEGRGNAFNEKILLELAREILGFDGLINSDSLMVSSQQGVSDLSSYERMVLFIKSGCDAGVISFNDADPATLLEQALVKGDLTRADLERAAKNRLLPRFQSGDMDNPYRDLDESVETFKTVVPQVEALAEEVNVKSVVLMKNHEDTLPLKDTSKKIYIQRFIGSTGGGQYAAFGFGGGDSTDTTAIAALFTAQGFTVVDKADDADIALLLVKPKGPDQGSNVLGVIDLVEDVESPTYDDDAKPTGDTKNTTTLIDVKNIKKVADKVHANGGTVIATIDISSPWILTNLEPYCDALLGVFSYTGADIDGATVKIITGQASPSGKLPMTMVASESVIELVETDLDGETWMVCVSPNDVPGYVKDQYMSADVLAASPSGSYAYKDACGNYYWSNFGLTYGD